MKRSRHDIHNRIVHHEFKVGSRLWSFSSAQHSMYLVVNERPTLGAIPRNILPIDFDMRE
jgi:hypothetical protein